MDIFEIHQSGKKARCKVCECWLPSNSDHVKSSHMNGKSHKQKCEFKERQNLTLQRSVYVRGFDPTLNDLESELECLFEKSGGKVKDIYVDKNSGKYCFVEFEDQSSVARVLSVHSLILGGKKLHVKPRMNNKKAETANNAKELNQQPDKNGPNFILTDDFFIEYTNIEEQMLALKCKYQLSKEDQEMRSLIAELLQSVLEEAYPNCKVNAFGSSVNGLGVKECDLDVTVCDVDPPTALEGETKLMSTEAAEVELLKEMRELLERFAPGFKNIFVVESQKNCSIIKMHHTDSQLQVDLSLNNRLALVNTNLLKCYISSDDNIGGFFFTLRLWAKMNNLIGRNGFQLTNYAFTLLIINFLQQRSNLHCLQTCHLFEDDLIGGWNCGYCRQHLALKEQVDSYGGKFVDFFGFYSESFANARQFAFGVHTMATMNRYELHPDLSRSDLIVQDPFKLSHNVSQNVNQSGLENIHELFKATHHRLSSLECGGLSLKDVLVVSSPKVSNKEPRNKQQKHKQQSSKTNSTHAYMIPLVVESQPDSNSKSYGILIQRFLCDTLQMKIQHGGVESLPKNSNLSLKTSSDKKNTDIFPESLSKDNSEIRATDSSIDDSPSLSNMSCNITVNKTPLNTDLSNKTNSESSSLSMTRSTKRKAEEDLNGDIVKNPLDVVFSTAVKKSKLNDYEEEDGDFAFTCVAKRETWLSRRKMRRRQLLNRADITEADATSTGVTCQGMRNTLSVEKIDDSKGLDNSMSAIEKNATTSISEKQQRQQTGLNRLVVRFCVSKTEGDSGATTSDSNPKNSMYNLRLELIEGDLKSYQTFFAFFKKEIVKVLSRHDNGGADLKNSET